jgi:hypothetical protein
MHSLLWPSPYQTTTSRRRFLHCSCTKSYTKVTDMYQSINAQVAFHPPQNLTQSKPGTPALPQTLHRIDITPSMSPTYLNTYQPSPQYSKINTAKNATDVVASTATYTPYHRIPHKNRTQIMRGNSHTFICTWIRRENTLQRMHTEVKWLSQECP